MSGEALTVTKDWAATHHDPIRVAAGEAVTPDGRREARDGHVWASTRAADGREGWLPDDHLMKDAGGWRAAAAFDAREPTCRSGDILDCLARRHGWALCRAADGCQGWVPLRHLAVRPIPTGARR